MINNEIPVIELVGNGLAGQEFPLTTSIEATEFTYYDTDDLVLYLKDSVGTLTLLVEGTEFTLETLYGGKTLPTGVILPDTVVLKDAYVITSPDKLRVVRDTPMTQEADFSDNTLELALDRLTAVVQEVRETIGEGELQTQVDDIESDLAELTADVGDVDATGWGVSVVTKMLEMLISIASNTSGIATNVTNIGTNTTNIATNVSSISSNATDIGTVPVAWVDLVTKISAIGGQVTTNTAAIAAMDIANYEPLATYTPAQAAQDALISTNASGVATNVSAISAIDTRVTAVEAVVSTGVLTGEQTVTNNDAVNPLANLVGKIVGGTDSAILLYYTLTRSNTTEVRVNSGEIYFHWDDTAWYTEDGIQFGDYSGVEFYVNTAGDVADIGYSTDSMDATGYTGNIKYQVKRFLNGVW